MFMQGLRTLEIAPQSPSSEQESSNLGGEEPSVSGGVKAELVIGQDTRTQITATTTYPFRVMGRIAVGCTGTLIGVRHVLTAGHCVYNSSNRKTNSNLDFGPGQNGANTPYGTISWKKAITVTGWTQSHLRDYDDAMSFSTRTLATAMVGSAMVGRTLCQRTT